MMKFGVWEVILLRLRFLVGIGFSSVFSSDLWVVVLGSGRLSFWLYNLGECSWVLS